MAEIRKEIRTWVTPDEFRVLIAEANRRGLTIMPLLRQLLEEPIAALPKVDFDPADASQSVTALRKFRGAKHRQYTTKVPK